MIKIRSPFTAFPFLVLLLAAFTIAGCTKDASGPKELRVGVLVTTGVDLMKSSTINVVKMMEKRFEAEGGILVGGKRYPVTFLIENIDGGVPEQAVTAVKKLINQKNISVIIGPQYSSDAIPAGEVAERSNVPLISSLSTHPRTTENRKYVFRISFLNDFQARAAARFSVRDLEAKRVAVVYNIANPYSKGLAEVFRQTILEQNSEVIAFESYVSVENDMDKILARVRILNPDIIYLPIFFQEVGPIVVKMRAMGIDSILIGSEAWDRGLFASMQEFEGAYMTAHWATDMPGESSRQFVRDYEEQFHMVPEDGAALTYDAMNMLFAGIQLKGAFDTESIRDGLYALDNFEGVTGEIDFVDNGDPQRDAVILQFKGGQVRSVKRIAPE
jgi:branched-chain amino acid transport system substrate-binding protein